MADLTHEVINVIGEPESETLQYKAVLPPAATLAQLISAFANTDGGYVILGVSDVGGDISLNGLSSEFRAEPITRRAIELLSPQPSVSFQYVIHQGKRLFVIKIERSSADILLGGREYIREAARTKQKHEERQKALHNPRLKSLADSVKRYRQSCTAARAKLLDHYESVLNICDDLAALLYPSSASVPTTNLEGKVLMRILFSSCADNFETYLSDLLLEIYLAKPETLKSEASVPVREILECADLQEFIESYAKKKVSKLQRGSVKGFIADNRQIRSLGVVDAAFQQGIEDLLQIRHLYSHRNGVVDEKFQKYFPSAPLNTEHQMSLDDFMDKCAYLLQAVDVVDSAALRDYQLASYQ